MLLRIVALIGVLLTGVVSHAGSSRHSIHPSATVADLRVLSTASVALKPEPRSQVLAWLARQRAVRWVRIASDGQTLDVHFRDGRMAAILPPTFGSVNLAAAAHHAAPRFHPAVRLQASPSHRALVLEPVDTELGLGPNAGDPEASRLKAAGFSVDSLYDTQVTVNSMAGISGYNVVYMHTHSYSS
ncbi:MAG: hypothetical protein M3Z66_15265, partial [Chloroflexota bacterium]|nr:hypothetical protein [Chloroflexota bacterium]